MYVKFIFSFLFDDHNLRWTVRFRNGKCCDEADCKHTSSVCISSVFCKLPTKDVKKVRNFKVICDKFEVINIYSSGNLYRKLSVNLIFLQFFPVAQQALVAQGLLTVEASRSHSVTHTTLSRTPLDEWSAQSRDLYLTAHNTHKRHTSMPPPGFEPTIPTSDHWERP
jgi:hypothetical protein